MVQCCRGKRLPKPPRIEEVMGPKIFYLLSHRKIVQSLLENGTRYLQRVTVDIHFERFISNKVCTA